MTWIWPISIVGLFALAGCMTDGPSGPAPATPSATEDPRVTAIHWDTAGLEGDVALRVAFAPAEGTCTFELAASGVYRSGSPVYLWAAPDDADPVTSVLVQDGVDVSVQGTSNHDLPPGPGAPWAGGLTGEIDLLAGQEWLFVAFALGPERTRVVLDVACDRPIPQPAFAAGRQEVAGLAVAGAQEGVGAGAGPVGLAASQAWSLEATSPEVLVRVVRPDQEQLAEEGTLVLEHPGGEETFDLPAPDPVLRWEGGPGAYRLRLDHVQIGSYLGVMLVAGVAPVDDVSSLGLTLTFASAEA